MGVPSSRPSLERLADHGAPAFHTRWQAADNDRAVDAGVLAMGQEKGMEGMREGNRRS